MFASRALWLLLIATSLLVGQAFIQAVNSYAEASGIGGGPAALAQGLSPLEGIVAPLFGAYDLMLTLLFPFVAIRLSGTERTTGALKLMQQWPASMERQVLAKLAALTIAWMLALLPAITALVMWRAYGGHLAFAETLNVFAGHTLRFLFTASFATAAGALVPGAANAAIVVLAFTIGTWALDFLAAGRGGLIERIATFTPAAVLRGFEQGLLRVDVVVICGALALLFFAIAAAALRPEWRWPWIAAIALLLIGIATQNHSSFDLSENRRNSFSRADERQLASIDAPLKITVFLAAEDPRMRDFETVLVKLRRSLRELHVVRPLEGRSGLFENDQRYGEIIYALRGKRVMSRSTTEEIVLETIDGLAGMQRSATAASEYPGYPLAVKPRGAAVVFYVVWPALIVAAFIWRRPRNRRTD